MDRPRIGGAVRLGRFAAAAAVWLLLGAGASVGVAWAIAVADRRVPLPAWVAERRTVYWIDPAEIRRSEEGWRAITSLPEEERRRWLMAVEILPVLAQPREVERYGFPLRTMSTDLNDEGERVEVELLGVALPARPVWPNLAVCSVVYALGLWAGLGWRGARARWRAWVGRCAACGYDRAGIGVGAACPECGGAGTP
jgi:hypothetical protein